MELRENKIKKKLTKGEVVIGTCMTALSPPLVELAGFSGYEWCRIDTEHNWRQDTTVEFMIRSAYASGISPIVRIDKDDPYLIRKVLEIGADGFIVPAIKSADEVKAIVEAAKFPPKGDRGFSGLCFAAGYGSLPGDEFVKWSDREQMVGIMIETSEAVADIENIMSVDGLDFVLFGPADYSMSIGLTKPNKNDPKVEASIKKTIDVAGKNGKYVMLGIGVPWKEEADRYIEMGIKMIEVGHDFSILGREWRKALKEING